MKVQVLVNTSGQVVAAGHVRSSDHHGIKAGISALEGQELVEVDVPEALIHMHPHDRLRAILKHRLDQNRSCLVSQN